jgi:hypothetical protein
LPEVPVVLSAGHEEQAPVHWAEPSLARVQALPNEPTGQAQDDTLDEPSEPVVLPLVHRVQLVHNPVEGSHWLPNELTAHRQEETSMLALADVRLSAGHDAQAAQPWKVLLLRSKKQFVLIP